MPKVLVDNTKGLYQQSGTGFVVDADAGIQDDTYGYYLGFIPDAAAEASSGAGAISVACYYTAVTTTGADALTLAAGTVVGQLKKIQLVVDGGNGTLTIANPVSSSLDVVTFADIGDTIELIWNGSAWRILAAYNCADGTSAPAIA